MVEEIMLNVKPGQKFRHKRKGTLYIVKSVKDESILLVSENGEAIMRIHLDSLLSSGFEPVYD
jgi:hypothetical protein